MKKIFAKYNEKFVKAVIVKTKTESNTIYLVDDNDNKLSPDYITDLYLKDLLVVNHAGGYIKPYRLFDAKGTDYHFCILYCAQEDEGSISNMELYSDGYTAG